MGTDVYLQLDPEARALMESERGTIPLPELPDGHLFGLGGYPFLLSGLTSLGAALRREPNAEDADLQQSYFAYIAEGREEAMQASGKHLEFVKSWGAAAEEGRFFLVTPDDMPLEGVLAEVAHDDAHTLLGKLLFLPAPESREDNLLVGGATLWVVKTCERQLEALPEEASDARGPLEITCFVTHVIGLYAMYAWRYGGSYVVSS